MAHVEDTGRFEPAHLVQWQETTRCYLFADLDSLAGPLDSVPIPLRQDSHGAQIRFIARVRGRLMRLVKRAPLGEQHCEQPGGQNSLQELERVFYSQVAFVALNPAVPRLLLGWLRDGDVRIQRRVQKVIDHYVSRLSGLIEQGKQQGTIRPDINPRSAAIRIIELIQRLVLQAEAGLHPREALFQAAAAVFTLYRAELAASAQ